VAGYGWPIDLAAAARAEVVGLHEFFVGWFTGVLDDDGRVFERLTGVLHREFSMIVPSGALLTRHGVIASVRSAHATAEGSFAIEIRDVVDHVVGPDVVLVTYEEWQYVGERVVDRRVSTAVFVPAGGTVHGVQWRHLHETFRST
jgi:hypothetical protein